MSNFLYRDQNLQLVKLEWILMDARKSEKLQNVTEMVQKPLQKLNLAYIGWKKICLDSILFTCTNADYCFKHN